MDSHIQFAKMLFMYQLDIRYCVCILSPRGICKTKKHQISSSQAGLRADGAGESALPAEESPWRLRALSRERELLEFYKKTASISSRERENRITLLAVVLILDPHLSYHLTFPLLSVGAVGDEGDPVWLCYPTILPELVKERTE